MDTALVDRRPWVISSNEDRPPAMEIALLKKTVVLSWSQFVYAEGSDDEIRIAFASHDVVVRGAGLSALLQAVSANKVSLLREPSRADCFGPSRGFAVREIEVRKVDGD